MQSNELLGKYLGKYFQNIESSMIGFQSGELVFFI